MIGEESHFIGRVAGSDGHLATLETLVLFQPGKEGPRLQGIRIQVTGVRATAAGGNNALVDLNELDGLANALNHMIAAISEWQGSNREHTEMVFTTQGDLQVGFSITPGKIERRLQVRVRNHEAFRSGRGPALRQ
jgi:hypothetical protein